VRSRFLYEYFFETGFYVPTMVALQRGRYKLIRYLRNSSWTELFDLTRDPLEITNLATSPTAASTLSSMSKALDDALRVRRFKIPTYADPEP
jgi:arylsulfatase A-like enzyme